MSDSKDARRRWLGMVVLTLAAAMLLCGQTFLAGYLQGATFILYWLLCFCLTVAAIVIALADLRVLRQRTRDAHRELVRDTFSELKKPEDRNDQKG